MKAWNGLQEFVSCVEFGSMAKAAENLGITKSSVSKRISQLEDKLNKKLFYRKSNSLYLTHHGELIYAKSKEVFASLNELEDILNDSNHSPEGKISVSMPLGVGENLIQPVIIAFCKKFHHVTFNLNFSVRRVDMVKEEFDLSFRLASHLDDDIVGKKLMCRPYHLIASAEIIEQYGVPSSPEELSKYPCLGYVEKHQQGVSYWPFKNKKNCKVTNFRPNPIICSNSIDSLVMACLSGAGILYCSEFFVVKYLQNGQLQSVLNDWIIEYNTLWLTFPCSLSLSHQSRAFVDYAAAYFLSMNNE